MYLTLPARAQTCEYHLGVIARDAAGSHPAHAQDDRLPLLATVRVDGQHTAERVTARALLLGDRAGTARLRIRRQRLPLERLAAGCEQYNECERPNCFALL